jgi:putative membrane protein
VSTTLVGTAPEVTARAFDRLPLTIAPARALLRYYMLSSLLAGPAFLIPMTYYYFRFRTLRYDLDEEGITMRWGILFRREVSLTFARIQDIQLTSNVVERWLGLARIQLQTASGSASAEMTIEGVSEFDALRDFFYARMRGTRDASAPAVAVARASNEALAGADELTVALEAVVAELRALRRDVETARGSGERVDA